MARSDTFDMKRFRKYFSFELKDTVSEQGLFVLLMGLVPVMMLIVALIYYFTFKTRDSQYDSAGFWVSYYYMKDFVAGVVFVLFFLIFPILRYGKLTDRKAGAVELMLPASHTEKFTSSILMSVVVAPVVFMVLYLGSDAIISGLNPLSRGSLISAFMEDGAATCRDNSFQLNTFFAFFLPPMVSCAGLAGAVLYKKNKISKTFLTCVVAFILFFILVINLIDNSHMTPEQITWSWYTVQSVATVVFGFYFWKRTASIQL